MKKFLAFFLAMVIALSLCACGSTEEAPRGEIVPGGQSNTPVATVPVETQPTETEPMFSFGSTAGGTYVNEYLGLSITVPEGYEFYTDEQIMALNNLAGSMVDEELAEHLQNASLIYDMYAMDVTTGSSVNVVLEKIGTVQALTINLQQVLEAQIETIRTSFESLGYTNINVSYQKVTIDGKEFDALVQTADIQGVPYYSITFCYVKGAYTANICVGTMMEDNTDIILDNITIA